MQVEHDIVLRNVPQPMRDSLRADVERRLAELERFCDRITSCRVLLEPSGQRHRMGNLFHVRVDLVLPGGEIVVRRDPPEDRAHVDPYVAVRDAFDAVRRQLEDHVRERFQAKTKVHVPPSHGRVARLLREQGYGFLEDSEGNSVYFHRNAVRGGGFERLEVGQAVRFVPHEGEHGPQASSVEVLGRHHHIVG